MINSIAFHNFRGLKHLGLPELSQITLLTGRNNAGKSSILEGIFLLMDHAAVDSFVKINGLRGLLFNQMDPSGLWGPAFYGMNTENAIRIDGALGDERYSLSYERDDSFVPAASAGDAQNTFSPYASMMGSTYTLKYRFQKEAYEEEGYFSINGAGLQRNIKTNQPNNQLMALPRTNYVTPTSLNNGVDNWVSDWLSRMDLEGKKQTIIDSLRIIEPELTNVMTITNQGQLQLYARIADQMLPVKLAGDGLNRLLYILLVISANPDSIILIDEIEMGFHHSMLKNLWHLIAKSAKENHCQIIATTHSYECIQNAVQGIRNADMEEQFCMYRVEHRDGENRAFHFDSEMVRQSVEMNMEVR